MSDNNFIQHVKDNWVIYVVAGQLIFNISISGIRDTNMEARINTLEAYQRTEQVTLTEIKTRLASIDTNLEYLKKQ